jgi:hypothetical protein
MKDHVMFPKNQLIPPLPVPKRPGWYWRAAVALLAICTLALGAVPALATPGGGEAVASTRGPFELQNTVTTLCLTDKGYGFVDTEVCTNGDRAQQWLDSASLPGSQALPILLINLQSGQCLANDSYGGGYGNLHTVACGIGVGSASQAWLGINTVPTQSAADIPGSQSLKNVQTGLCLESDISVSLDTGPVGGNAYAQDCTDWHWQWWTFPTL